MLTDLVFPDWNPIFKQAKPEGHPALNRPSHEVTVTDHTHTLLGPRSQIRQDRGRFGISLDWDDRHRERNVRAWWRGGCVSSGQHDDRSSPRAERSLEALPARNK